MRLLTQPCRLFRRVTLLALRLPAAPQLFQVKEQASHRMDLDISPGHRDEAVHGDGGAADRRGLVVAQPVVAPAPAPTRPRAKAGARSSRSAADPRVISLIHRDDPSACSPFDTNLRCSQMPNGKKDCKEFGKILGDLRMEYKDMAKNGATSVNFLRPVRDLGRLSVISALAVAFKSN